MKIHVLCCSMLVSHHMIFKPNFTATDFMDWLQDNRQAVGGRHLALSHYV